MAWSSYYIHINLHKVITRNSGKLCLNDRSHGIGISILNPYQKCCFQGPNILYTHISINKTGFVSYEYGKPIVEMLRQNTLGFLDL